MATTLMRDVLQAVHAHPGSSASELAPLVYGYQDGNPYRAATVMSTLRRLAAKGQVERVAGGGPRGGDTWRPMSTAPHCCECSRVVDAPTWPDRECARCSKPLCPADLCRRRHADGC